MSNFGESTISENGATLLELCTDMGLCIINNRAGRDAIELTRSQSGHSSSILDYVIISDSLYTEQSDAEVLTTNLGSDHKLLHVSLNSSPTQRRPPDRPPRRRRR